MVLARLIALFDLRRLSIPRNSKFVLSGLNRSKPEIFFPGKSAWFPGSIEKKLKILKLQFYSRVYGSLSLVQACTSLYKALYKALYKLVQAACTSLLYYYTALYQPWLASVVCVLTVTGLDCLLC